MVDAVLDQMVDFSMAMRSGVVPADVLAKSRDLIVDTLGCGVGGRDAAAAHAARAFPATPTGDQGGAVIGCAESHPVDTAAFWNSAMSRCLDFNDTYPPATHPSDMIGALVAASRPAKASGRDLLVANVVAYEVYGKVSRTVLTRRPLTLDYGYAVCVGAAAGLSHLFGLDAGQTRQAIAMAATSGIQLRANRAGQLSDYKGVQTAVSARDAVFFTFLAQQGITGPSAPFEGRHGIVELMDGAEGPLPIPDFSTWGIFDAWLKYWPCTYNNQITIWSALKLRELVEWELIESVTIYTNSFLKHESGSEPAKWDPKTRQTADHSLPYVFSRTMQHGVLDAGAYTPEAIADPVVRTLMNRLTVEIDPALDVEWPSKIGQHLAAVDVDGVTHVVESSDPRGHTLNPMTREDIERKFLSLTAPALGDERAARAFKLAWECEAEESFDTILASLVVAG